MPRARLPLSPVAAPVMMRSGATLLALPAPVVAALLNTTTRLVVPAAN